MFGLARASKSSDMEDPGGSRSFIMSETFVKTMRFLRWTTRHPSNAEKKVRRQMRLIILFIGLSHSSTHLSHYMAVVLC